jgi:hypothetical protein
VADPVKEPGLRRAASGSKRTYRGSRQPTSAASATAAPVPDAPTRRRARTSTRSTAPEATARSAASGNSAEPTSPERLTPSEATPQLSSVHYCSSTTQDQDSHPSTAPTTSDKSCPATHAPGRNGRQHPEGEDARTGILALCGGPRGSESGPQDRRCTPNLEAGRAPHRVDAQGEYPLYRPGVPRSQTRSSRAVTGVGQSGRRLLAQCDPGCPCTVNACGCVVAHALGRCTARYPLGAGPGGTQSAPAGLTSDVSSTLDVTVLKPIAPPTITSPRNGSTFDGPTLHIAGTGLPGAQLGALSDIGECVQIVSPSRPLVMHNDADLAAA